MTLSAAAEGGFYASGQVEDYALRPREMEDFCVLDYLLDSYEAAANRRPARQSSGTARGRGRPPNDAFRYLEGHPKYEKMCRRLRTVGHNTLPTIQGKHFLPRCEDDALYCASMLMLLKPWRNPNELKAEFATWKETFQLFTSNADKRVLDIIQNIEYYYQTSDAATREREAQRWDGAEAHGGADDESEVEDVDAPGLSSGDFDSDAEDEIVRGWEENNAEFVHGITAIRAGNLAGVFQDDNCETMSTVEARVGSGDDYRNVLEWQTRLNETTAGSEGESGFGVNSMDEGAIEHVQHLVAEALGSVNYLGAGGEEVSEDVMSSVDPSDLFEEQRRAYDIVHAQVHRCLRGTDPEPLLMIVSGEGGVGKSKVIQTITALFESLNVKHWLRKAAYTGVAASLIEGQTLHTLTSLPRSKRAQDQSPETIARLSRTIGGAKFLIIDEISMVPSPMLAEMDAIITRARAGQVENHSGRAFGGMNVILFGDFHQFPPVGAGVSVALFADFEGRERDERCVDGRRLYEQFQTVVKLRKQVRVTDPRWQDLLQHARHGNCNAGHLRLLRSLIISKPECPVTDFASEPWRSAVLITPRHAVRRPWNAQALRAHCARTGATLYVCRAQDRFQHRRLDKQERLAVRKKKEGKSTQDVLELAIGMKCMVTFNVSTNADITNGARGVVHDIVLRSEEDVERRGRGIVKLKRLPAYVLVKLDRTRAIALPGFPTGVIPVVPMEKTFSIVSATRRRAITVKRLQFPLTAAYAFTDYRAQGQTIPNVLIDIRKPPSFPLTAFNAYVALSRSAGTNNIRLIGDFEDVLFTQHPNEMLRREDRRLEELDRVTKSRWEGEEARAERHVEGIL